MTDPLVSICIPTYNGEQYLRASLDSAISQTYRAIEIIVVDDQSKDSTIQIVEEYQQKDKRIQLYINEKNLGLVGNWNKCLALAKGKWIKFLFQDDVLFPKCIETMVGFAGKEIRFVVCDRELLISEDTPELIRNEFEEKAPRIEDPMHTGNAIFFTPKSIAKIVSRLAYSNFIGEPTVALFRKDVVDEYGVFNSNFVQICDFEYWLRIASNIGMCYVPEKLVLFRVHEQSMSAANRDSSKGAVDRFWMLHLFMTHDYYRTLRSNISKFTLIKFKEMLRINIYETSLRLHDNKELQSHYNLMKASIPLVSKYETLSWTRRLMYFFVKLRRKTI